MSQFWRDDSRNRMFKIDQQGNKQSVMINGEPAPHYHVNVTGKLNYLERIRCIQDWRLPMNLGSVQSPKSVLSCQES